MKKTILPGIAVLLTLIIFSCDLNQDNTGDPDTKYTEDGRLMKAITINTDVSRALTPDLARPNLSYYEVAFKDNNGRIYRASWSFTQNGVIHLPLGTGITYPDAVMFAGRFSDKVLFAVGLTDTLQITNTTTSITFTLTALTNNVSAENDSTFRIEGTNQFPTPTETFLQFSGSNITVPVFLVPKNVTGVTARYSIGGLDNFLTRIYYHGGAQVFSLDINAPIDMKLSAPDGFALSSDVVENAKITIPIPPNDTTGVLSSGNFTLTFNTPNKVGFSKIFIEVPVYALSNTDNAIRWIIQGGHHNFLLDGGAGSNSIGAAVVLGVGLQRNP